MKYLIVVAHPDDEVLGAGASIKKWTLNGDSVDVCVMCHEAKARSNRPSDGDLDADSQAASDYLGIGKRYEGSFPNIEMNTVPHLKLVQFIEKAIQESGPDVLITHHPSDTNNDHVQTSLACQEAFRIFQRRPNVKPIKEFWYMEVGSATDWNVNTAISGFRPDVFVEVDKDGVEAKIKALGLYREVMRSYPHPRSGEAISGLITWRGSQAGLDYAEAFECAIRRIQFDKKRDSKVSKKPMIYMCLAHMGGREMDFVKEAFDTNWVVPLGPNVDGFEKDLESFMNGINQKVTNDKNLLGKQVAALSSGTAAVHLAMINVGIEAGDEVLCQSFTFCASVNPVAYLGAKPIFVDSEKDTYNMDPDLLEVAIKDRIARTGKKPKAIVVVYLYGMPAKIDKIFEVARKYEIPVIEDAAEALGSTYDGQLCGSFGQYGVLSFNGNKMITTSGGGALICPDAQSKKSIVFYSTQAREPMPYYQHEKIGFNYRLSNVCAGIGRGQMIMLPEHLSWHRKIHQFYVDAFASLPGVIVHSAPDKRMNPNYWLSTILLDPAVKIVIDGKESGIKSVVSDGGQPNDNVEQLRIWLDQQGIESRALWKPLHCMPVYHRNAKIHKVADGVTCHESPYAVSYVNGVSENLFSRGLCLPSGPFVSEEDAQKVVDCIKQVVKY